MSQASEGNELPTCLSALGRILAFLFHSSVQCVPFAAGKELSGQEYMVKSIAAQYLGSLAACALAQMSNDAFKRYSIARAGKGGSVGEAVLC